MEQRMVGRGVHPHYIQEFENKRVAKWGARKCMKRKRGIFVGGGRGETQNGNGSLGAEIERFGESGG
jgi:hypothetical protein